MPVAVDRGAAESFKSSSVLLCWISIDCNEGMIDHFVAVGDCGIAMVVSAINMPDKSSANDRVLSI